MHAVAAATEKTRRWWSGPAPRACPACATCWRRAARCGCSTRARFRRAWPSCGSCCRSATSILATGRRRRLPAWTRSSSAPASDWTAPALVDAAARGVPLLGDIELFARAVTRPVLAITGSNGKSTVTTLVGQMLTRCRTHGGRGRQPGHAGARPAGRTVAGCLRARTVVVPAGTHREPAPGRRLRAEPQSRPHRPPRQLRRLCRRQGAGAGRRRGGGAQPRRCRASPHWPAGLPPRSAVVWFGLGAPTGANDFGLLERDGAPWLARGDEALLPAAALRLPGRHNIANALAALALVDALGVPLAQALPALREFRRPAASHAVGGRARRRGLVRRFQGHQRGRHPGRHRGSGADPAQLAGWC